MKLIIFPLLFSVACIAYGNRDRIADQYNAAYPADPAKRAAIEDCITRNPNFNRLDADDRTECYRGVSATTVMALAPSPAAAIAMAPTSSPYYAYNPSHLAGNDVRRRETNDNYLQENMIRAAAARPVVVIPTAYRTAALAHRPAQPNYRHMTVASR